MEEGVVGTGLIREVEVTGEGGDSDEGEAEKQHHASRDFGQAGDYKHRLRKFRHDVYNSNVNTN